MNRFILILVILVTLCSVNCQNNTAKIAGPAIIASEPPKCTSVLCKKNTDNDLDELIQKVAKSCRCGCQKQPVYLDLYSLCQGYTNYDPATNSLIQCVINKLSNPCYKEFNGKFEEILNDKCGCVCKKRNFNIYTFLSDVCYSCNGCLDDCYIQNGDEIRFTQPLEAGAAKKVSAA